MHFADWAYPLAFFGGGASMDSIHLVNHVALAEIYASMATGNCLPYSLASYCIANVCVSVTANIR